MRTNPGRRRRKNAPHAKAPLEALERRTLFSFVTWDGGGGDANWTTAANWEDDAAPLADGSDYLIFPEEAAQKANVNDFPAGTEFAIAFIGSGYTLSGNAVGLGAYAILDMSEGANVIDLDLNLLSPTAISDDNGSPAEGLTINGVISGAASVSLGGSGSLTLTAANTMTGDVSLTGYVYAANPTASVFGDVDVMNFGTLAGNGTVTGKLFQDGNLSPGQPNNSILIAAAPGFPSVDPNVVDTLTLNGGLDGSGQTGNVRRYWVDVLDGEESPSYDQVFVHGAVDLGNGTQLLNLRGTYEGLPGDKLFVLVNEGTDEILGHYQELEQGQLVVLNEVEYTVSYHGDSESGSLTEGNDVVLYVATGEPNQAPVITVPGTQETTEDESVLFSEDTDNAISIADPDSGDADIRVFLYTDTLATIHLPGDPSDLITDGANDLNFVELVGSQADINDALDGMSIVLPDDATDTVTLAVNTSDLANTGTGGAQMDVETVTIEVSAVNDAPTVTIPDGVDAVPGVALAIPTGEEGVAIQDPDAFGDTTLRVAMTSTHGTISIQTQGLTYESGTNGSHAITYVAAATSLESILAATRYTPDENFTGTGTITLTVNDLGHTGSGGAKQGSGTLDVHVSPLGQFAFSAATYTVAEDAGSGVATITVNRSVSSTRQATVSYFTTDETTTAGDDYEETSGTLTFGVGQTSKTFTIPIVDDDADEANEVINVYLGEPSHATLGSPSSATLTIADDDDVPALSIGDASGTESPEAGPHVATFTVTLSAPSVQTITVHYVTANGTALAANDYSARTGTLTFQPGETSKTIDVPVLYNLAAEQVETFTVTLSDPTNATIAQGEGTGTGTITDGPTNADPEAADDAVTLAAGQASININVLANDDDADGDDLAVFLTDAPAHGTAHVNDDGTIRYSPAAGYSGADELTYTILDGKGGAATATVAITVTGNATIVNPTDPTKTDVFIAASNEADEIEVVRVNGKLVIKINGEEQGSYTANGNIVISGGGGDDVLTLGKIKNPVLFNGGEGNDTLGGGTKGDVLIGGPGDDTLNAGAGRDLIIGGEGADTIYGLGGNDLIIAGSTAYDADTAENRAALNDLLTELARGGRASTKLEHFLAGVGESKAKLVAGETVFDDGEVDTLAGGGGNDFFVAQTAPADGEDEQSIAADVLTKRAANERVIEL